MICVTSKVRSTRFGADDMAAREILADWLMDAAPDAVEG